MANPGAGNKFVSVNLNKSYVQANNHSYGNLPSTNHASYGSGTNRGRVGGYGGAVTGGSGGMVVLSRPRSSHKAGPKLSVPPPLNLPSLRKEHEKFDSLGSVNGQSGGGISGGGPRPSSSGMGWTKPATVASPEVDGFGSHHRGDAMDQNGFTGGDGVKGSSVYMPPSARSGVVGSSASVATVAFPLSEKAPVLRGEDFPSLRAALPSANTTVQKHKDGLNYKQKQVSVDGSRFSAPVDMRPQLQSFLRTNNGMNENSSRTTDQVHKRDEYVSGPLPVFRMNHRSDWADDERDTSYGLTDRGRDHLLQKTEAYWDRDFDMPRVSVLPQKPVQNSSERWGSHDNEAGKIISSEVPKADPYNRDVSVTARPSSANREVHKENSYVSVQSLETTNGSFGKRDSGYAQGGKQTWFNNNRERYGNEQHSRFRDNTLQNSSMPRLSYTSSSRGMPVHDPILNFSKEKRQIPKSEKPYVEDFGTSDPFTGSLLGVVKRKKDVVQQTDFHDPVRESFEAELERVQKMQEQERQRVIEEQERAVELARREEEERARIALELEERHRKLEEEARESAWRAEQERTEAMQRADEQRIAREEEKRRMFLEEERRKQAAKQMLLELEERMAKRQASSSALVDDQSSLTLKEKDASDWEEGERMVERITTSASSDSSSMNRTLELNSRTHLPRDGSALLDRPKPINSWRRDTYDTGFTSTLQYQDQENSHHRTLHKGSVPPRTYHKGGVSDSHMEDFTQNLRGQRWNISGDGNPNQYGRNPEIDPEIHDQLVEKFDDISWGQGRARNISYPQYPEQLYPNSEADGPSYGRSRCSLRQPRVLPPPSASMDRMVNSHQASFRAETENSGPTSYQDSEPTTQTENLGQPELINVSEENEQGQDGTSALRCDSQSSLSVSSAPSTPTHLSHDDLDESGEPGNSKNRDSEVVGLPLNVVKENTAASAGEDEDDDWGVDDSERLQEQEEYDEDEDGYDEEDEVHEGEDSNIDLRLEKESSDMVENLVLGFNEGIEVILPSDDNNEGSFAGPQAVSNAFDGMCGDEEARQTSDASQLTTESSVSQNAPHTVSPSSSGLSSQHTPNVPAVPNQADGPVKLQFGLFSGPSLIPSPVPAIQIGSIQMPLHLHPQVGPPITHMHSSQPPLFQFGQLRYTQGLMPLTHQPLTYVQPNIPFNKTPVGPIPIQPTPESLIKNDATIRSASNDASQRIIKEDNLTVSARERNELLVAAPSRSEISHVGDDSKSKMGIIREMLAQPVIRERDQSGRGRKFVFAAKNTGVRSQPAPEFSRVESNGYQRRSRRSFPRTEFRVRESIDKRQYVSMASSSSDDPKLDEKSNSVSRAAHRRVVLPHKASKYKLQSDVTGFVPHGSREKGSSAKVQTQNRPWSGEGKLKRNICSEEDLDAPLQSGVVRVYEQPGIEAPSDEDDFIEVRSKRQMVNDRREQREKEIKAKSWVAKAPRKSRATSKIISNANMGKAAPSSGEASNVATDVRLAAVELSAGFNTPGISHQLAPIGTPAVKSDSQAIRPVQSSSNPVASGAAKNLGSGSAFDNKTKVLDGLQTSLSSWGNARINQQVMALTQTQLDDAMKPGQFDSRASVGNHTCSEGNSSAASSSIVTNEMSISSPANPVNSLLAGEKIQFGAVTSPTILPPSNRVVSHGIGQIGINRSEAQISQNDCHHLYEKEKCAAKSRAHLEDCEAEAEAAASAVAVAAIGNDEIASVTVSGTSSFGGTGIDGITPLSNGASVQRFSRTEESLSVSLPADLSVETPPISLWPPLLSPPNSHFPAGPPSHFPFYEMNMNMNMNMSPMLGGPVYAYGPHDEGASAAAQPQQQKSAAPWQHGVDSFYGPPAGFTGPFVPGGPPHMVVYNHFAPVGQFGQVGLSFMGATYIPSGKQADWKHNPGSSSPLVGEGDLSMIPVGQRNPANLHAPIRHLAPGSPLLPMASPMAMFDVSPFQPSPDMSVQARWPHIPASSIQSIPLSMPLQQQADGLPVKINHVTADPSLPVNRLPRNPSPSELGLVNTSSSVNNSIPLLNPVTKSLSVTISPDTGKSDMAQNGNNAIAYTPSSQIKSNIPAQQYGHSNYGYHRAGAPQRNNAGEWPHRRTGFPGRNSSTGGEKSYHSSKVKQIYVAKQSAPTGQSPAAP